MAAIVPIVNAASAIAGLLLTALQAAQSYASVINKAAQEGREVNVADLKALRDVDGIVDAGLEAAITAHGG